MLHAASVSLREPLLNNAGLGSPADGLVGLALFKEQCEALQLALHVDACALRVTPAMLP